MLWLPESAGGAEGPGSPTKEGLWRDVPAQDGGRGFEEHGKHQQWLILGGGKEMKLPFLFASRGVSRKPVLHISGIQGGCHFEPGTANWGFVMFQKAWEEPA